MRDPFHCDGNYWSLVQFRATRPGCGRQFSFRWSYAAASHTKCSVSACTSVALVLLEFVSDSAQMQISVSLTSILLMAFVAWCRSWSWDWRNGR